MVYIIFLHQSLVLYGGHVVRIIFGLAFFQIKQLLMSQQAAVIILQLNKIIGIGLIPHVWKDIVGRKIAAQKHLKKIVLKLI